MGLLHKWTNDGTFKELEKPLKCKLELHQPKMMCCFRDEVKCNYRGKILATNEDSTISLIEFKYLGEVIVEPYHKDEGFYDNYDLKDIKMRR